MSLGGGGGGGGAPMPEGASPVQMPNYLGIRRNLHRHEFGGWGVGGGGGGLQCLKGPALYKCQIIWV